ncbi:hypothetical protein PanWU01x14_323250 [Parasponia andersonii]|uniref:Uncharacterized protein n=1 Tax=Parasponia andersonii TaxID=3476 RepID=A0A2P5AKK9_PARAD|nr:hypothetical protein PanWU01x14_323250 [Parasponia andersonii]
MLESATALLTFSIVQGPRVPRHFACNTRMLLSKMREHRGALKAALRHFPFCMNDGLLADLRAPRCFSFCL